MDSFWSIVFLVTIIASFWSLSRADYSYTVKVDSLHGNDSSCKKNPSVPCQTLHQAFQLPHRSSTQYILSEGTHYLSENVTFENLEKIAFVGSNSTINCRVSDVGFAFTDMTSLSFANLTITGCSALRNSTSRNFHNTSGFSLYTFYVGLYFYHCRDVEMSGVTVRDSPNAIGVVMYDTDGTVAITSSTFTNNSVSADNSERPYPGGGGFYVEFSYCIPGDQSCNRSMSIEDRNTGARYNFSDCTFELNRANNSDSSDTSTYIVPYHNDHESFGRGGGLSIFVKGTAKGNIFNITGCKFVSNEALWGAGLFVEFHDDAADNIAYVTRSHFTNNMCHYSTDSGTGGGGMRIGHYVYGMESYGMESAVTGGNNTVTIDTCQFYRNSALNGGGLSISPTLQAGDSEVSNISIINSNFSRNVARLGSAIHIDRFSLILRGHMLALTIMDCLIKDNSNDFVNFLENFQYKGDPYEVGIGAVYIKNVAVRFKKNVTFIHNYGSALAVVGTPVHFGNSSAVFNENNGKNGGAIALLGHAYIEVNNFTNMTFDSNLAASEGGAIFNKYIEKENLKSYTNCFFRHQDPFLHPDDWSSYFRFYNNTDLGGARNSSIYSTSILPCSWGGGSGVSNNKTGIFCWKGWDYCIDYPCLQKQNCSTNEVYSDVGNIAFVGSTKYNHIKAFPGMQFHLPVTIHDDYHTDISSQTVFLAYIKEAKNAAIGSYGNFSTTSYITEESTTVRGPENTSLTLQLDSIGDREWHLEVVIELQMCPPGFKVSESGPSSNTTSCVCADKYGQYLYCDPNSLKAILKDDNWMGTVPEVMDKDNHYVVAVCPPGYCYSNTASGFVYLPNNTESLNEQICGHQNRKGILCGECVDGFAPAVNTFLDECVNCTNVNIASNVAKYVASVYIPLGFLFTILILFDIRLTTGPANAFILYCQVVASTFDLNADGQIPLNLITNSSKIAKQLVAAYRVPYGVFNLEFIENFLPPLCLGTNLNNLSVFLLDYAVAISPLLMIILVILFVKVTGCVTPTCNRHGDRLNRFRATFAQIGEFLERRSISESILPAFAAFLLLSYTKFSIVSSYLVGSQPLLKEDGSPISPSRVYFAGNFKTTDTYYRLHYLLPSILVFATFVSITPILLLDYPLRVFEWCIGKVDCMWKRYPVDKVHVLLDTFQGCYKNKMRFFAGLYFLFRLAINLSYVLTDTWLEQFVVQQIACTIMIMLLALCQPYERKFLNYVDLLIFINLAVLNALSFYLYSFALNNPHLPPPTSAFVIQYLLVFLPLFYMLGYIIWRVTKPCHYRIKHYFKETFFAVLRRLKLKGYQPLNQVARNNGSITVNNTSQADLNTSMGDDEMFARAEVENTYRPRLPNDRNSLASDSRSTKGSSSVDSGLRSGPHSGSTGPSYGSTGTTSRSDETTFSTS